MAHKPGRETDVLVHKILRPYDLIVEMTTIRDGELVTDFATLALDAWEQPVPAYTKDLMVWPAIDGEWAMFNRDSIPGAVFVEVEWEKWDDPQRRLEMLTYAEAEIGEGTWQQAVAFALAMCVLEWSERSRQ